MSKFAIFFILLYGAGLISVFAYNGAAAFFLYQIVYLFNPEGRWWGSEIPDFRYSFLTSILMILMLAIRYSELSKVSSWRKQPVFAWMLLFLLMHFIAQTYALNPMVHSRFTEYYWKLVVVMLVAYKLLSTEKLVNSAIWVYLLGAGYIGYYGTSMGRDGGGRLSSIGLVDTSMDTNGAAAALVPSLVMLLYYGWQSNWKVRIVVVLCSAFIVNALILANSRGAFLGAAVGGGLFIGFMLFSRYQKAGQRLTAVAIVICGLAGALSLTDETFWNRMQTLEANEQGQRGGDGRDRMYFWFGTFEMLKDYPQGMGIGGFPTLSGVYLDQSKVADSVQNRSVHSIWFQVLGEFGWLGLFIFLGMLVTIFRISNQTKRYLLSQNRTDIYFKILALQCALIGFLVAASFIDRARAEILYWMILFLASSANVYYLQHLAKEKIASERQSLLPGEGSNQLNNKQIKAGFQQTLRSNKDL